MIGSITPYGQREFALSRPLGARKALARLEAETYFQAAELRSTAMLGYVGLRAVTDLSRAEAELAKLAPPEARLRLAAIGDAVTAAIQARLLNGAIR